MTDSRTMRSRSLAITSPWLNLALKRIHFYNRGCGCFRTIASRCTQLPKFNARDGHSANNAQGDWTGRCRRRRRAVFSSRPACTCATQWTRRDNLRLDFSVLYLFRECVCLLPACALCTYSHVWRRDHTYTRQTPKNATRHSNETRGFGGQNQRDLVATRLRDRYIGGGVWSSIIYYLVNCTCFCCFPMGTWCSSRRRFTPFFKCSICISWDVL